MTAMVALCVGFSSCSKDDDEGGGDDDLSNFKKGIVGTWKYDAYSKDLGNYSTWQTVDSTKTITFKADGSCSVNSWTSYIMEEESSSFIGGWYTFNYYVRFDPTDQEVNDDTYHWEVGLIDKDTMGIMPNPKDDGWIRHRYVRVP
jgi:hypothetical protein